MDVEEVRLRIAQCVFRAEGRKGHLKWSVLAVAKSAKVSRSLIYYHFGKTKKEILVNCLGDLAEDFYGLKQERQSYEQISLAESLLETCRMYRENAFYAIFYQQWRQTPSIYQDKYIEIEQRYEAKLRRNFPKAKQAEIRALHAAFHGIVTAPFTDQQSIEAAVELLRLKDLV